MFAESRMFQQFIDHRFDGSHSVELVLSYKSFYSCRLGVQAYEIEPQTTNQSVWSCGGSGDKPLRLHSSEHPKIDRRGAPLARGRIDPFDFWLFWLSKRVYFRWFKGPMFSPRSSLLNPEPKRFALMIGDRFSSRWWRHHLIRIQALDAIDKLTQYPFSRCFIVQSQVCLSVRCIGTVAMKTMLGENRSNLEAKVDPLALRVDLRVFLG